MVFGMCGGGEYERMKLIIVIVIVLVLSELEHVRVKLYKVLQNMRCL